MNPFLKSVVATAVTTALAGSFAVAQPAPPDAPPAGGQDAPPPPPAPAQPTTLKGTVLGCNYGPAGDVNGLILVGDDDKTVQVNFPPAFAMMVKTAAAVGQAVTVVGRTLPPPPGRGPDADAPKPMDHTVLELDTLTGVDGKAVQMPKPGEEKTTHVDGRIKYLNYSRDGRAVGAILDDGTFVITGPAAAAELKLAVGQALAVDGQEHAAPGTFKIVQATKVNGTAVKQPRRPGPMGGPMGGPGGPGRGPGGGPGQGGPDGQRRGPDGDGPPPPPPAN